jgi:predicted TPR repeat methyltransferase
MANPATPQSLSADDLRHAFALACTAQTEGRLEEARQQYLVLLGYLPESALLHYNIGLIYFDFGDFVQALQQFILSASSGPEDADTLFNLALCQKKTGDQAAAIATYQRILITDPNQADCHYNLGGCYRDLHDDEQAIACYQRVLAMDPDYLAAANNLAYLFHRAGEVDQAVLHYTQVLGLRPEDESVRYLLASLLGTPLDHAPDAYVRNFFDTYAEGFEHSLVDELGYDNPQKLYECLCNSSARSSAYEHGLDLGCGTGLSGLSFKGVVTVLDGVDLSRNMLTQAAQKDCYTLLYPDSISHHLDATGETYDFFLATDVFIYVGDLFKIFTAAQAIARPEALFCFSTEHLAADGFQLLQTGRFAYSHDYIRQIAASTGWTVLALEPTLLRKEREVWISGDLWILRIDTPPA